MFASTCMFCMLCAAMKCSNAIIFALLLLCPLDPPNHLVMATSRLYVARGMLGRLDCPVDANPPVALTVWSKDERIIDSHI